MPRRGEEPTPKLQPPEGEKVKVDKHLLVFKTPPCSPAAQGARAAEIGQQLTAAGVVAPRVIVSHDTTLESVLRSELKWSPDGEADALRVDKETLAGEVRRLGVEAKGMRAQIVALESEVKRLGG